METIKDILNFCNNAVLFDFKNIGVVIQLKNVRNVYLIIFMKQYLKVKY